MPIATPSTLPPMIDRTEISAVRRSPASRKGRFFMITSGITRYTHDDLPRTRHEQEPVADGRYQQQVEQGYRDIDLEGAERLPLDRARFIGKLGHRDHGSERGVLDQLGANARKRGSH